MEFVDILDENTTNYYNIALLHYNNRSENRDEHFLNHSEESFYIYYVFRRKYLVLRDIQFKIGEINNRYMKPEEI